MADDFIRRSEAIEFVKNNTPSFGNSTTMQCVVRSIQYAPSADVVEVVHSKWILYTDGSGECERCHARQKNVWDFENWQNFCGHCGAKMDGDKNE